MALTGDQIAEARSLIDPVAAGAGYAGKPLAAANVSVALPSDPLLALWQQIMVVREWRGDAHFMVLANNEIGPCDCNVMHAATGRAAATARLAARGWLNSDGTVTDAGTADREQAQVETDKQCAALWAPIGNAGILRLSSLITPITMPCTAAGTYGQFRS